MVQYTTTLLTAWNLEPLIMTSEDLDLVYYCDACSVARASHLIKLLDGELAFCGHHYNKNKEALDKKAYEVIELNKMEEAIPQLEKAE
jgi:hypothetical protein